LFNRIVFFDETLNCGEDTDLFLRAWENEIKKVVMDEVMFFFYRKHEDNMTNDQGKDLIRIGFVRVFKRHLERCRRNVKLSAITPKNMPKIAEYLGKIPDE
jgi:hypothetical protein